MSDGFPKPESRMRDAGRVNPRQQPGTLSGPSVGAKCWCWRVPRDRADVGANCWCWRNTRDRADGDEAWQFLPKAACFEGGSHGSVQRTTNFPNIPTSMKIAGLVSVMNIAGLVS